MDNPTYTKQLIAIFENRAQAESARAELVGSGIGRERIELLSSDDMAESAASGNAGLSGRQYDNSGGGIAGFFRRMFGSDADEDKAYQSEATKDGRYSLVVQAPENAIDIVSDTLNRNGAIDVEKEGQADYGSGRDDPRRAGGNAGDHAEIPVVNEEMRVGKRAIRRGGVRVYTKMSEQPVEQNIPLREERVRVERRPADRPATEADFEAASRGVIEVTETVEEPIVEKRARVVEEVVVNKDVRERTENVRDSVRHSDVHVEDVRGGRTAAGDADQNEADFRNHFQTQLGNQGRYEDFAPAYRYGSDMASDPRYRGRRFNDVQPDLEAEYTRRNPDSAWERMKESIRYGWDKVASRR